MTCASPDVITTCVMAHNCLRRPAIIIIPGRWDVFTCVCVRLARWQRVITVWTEARVLARDWRRREALEAGWLAFCTSLLPLFRCSSLPFSSLHYITLFFAFSSLFSSQLCPSHLSSFRPFFSFSVLRQTSLNSFFLWFPFPTSFSLSCSPPWSGVRDDIDELKWRKLM